MNYLPNILISNVFLLIIWISYELLMSRTRLFQANRAFLLGGSVLAVILPWLPWQVNFMAPAGYLLGLPVTGVTAGTNYLSAVQIAGESAGSQDPTNWIQFLYLAIVAILFLVSAGQLFRLHFWTKTRPVFRWDGKRIVVLNKTWSAFSFFRTIYYPEPFDPASKQTRTILDHENVHIRQLHSIDNLIILVIRILFFYNPVIYLIAGKIRLVHEFIADDRTSGYDKEDYSNILISHQFMLPQLLIMHSFNNKSFLKRRLTMLSKTKQNRLAGWKYLLVLPLMAGMVLLSGWSSSLQDQTRKTREEIAKMAVEKELTKAGFSKADIEEIKVRIDGVPYTKEVLGKPAPVKDDKGTHSKDAYVDAFLVVEEMPTFEGGREQKFCEWVSKNVKYPEEALKGKKTGTVYVSFIVDKSGSVIDPKIAKSDNEVFNPEVLRVIQSSPKWTPGKQRGKNVMVAFTIPVKFNLN